MIKTRRGLSTAVGSIFFIIAASTAIGYTAYSMNALETYNEKVLVSTEKNIERIDEEFKISKVTIDNNKFNITIQNTGKNPINITRLWIDNRTDTDGVNKVFKFETNKSVYPGQIITKIGQNLSLTALTSQAYDLKLVTERGNIEEYYVNAASTAPLYLQLHVLPETVTTEFTTTVMLSVTNNNENGHTILNLSPTPTITINKNSCALCDAVQQSGPTPDSYPILAPGDTANFKWIYKITGEPDDRITFTASLQNGYPGNTASADVIIKEVVSALESGTALTSLGLSPLGTADILYLHDETFFTPSSSYQLSSASPDMSGDFIDVDNEDPSWFTNNGTNTIIIPSGKWNAVLQYITEYLPDSLVASGGDNQVDMIYHFDANSNDQIDSAAKTNGLDLCTSSSKPQYQSSGGPHGSPYYNFVASQSDCMISQDDTTSSISDIDKASDTTALWFRTGTKTSDSRQVMVRFEENAGGADDYYQISIGDGTSGNRGKVVFDYTTDQGTNITKCVSTGRLDNNVWHHVVAVRQSDDDCQLYIDGQLHHTITRNDPGNTVNVDGKWYVGYNQGEGEYYDGDIDDLIHWNKKALTSTEVTELYNANFGTAATTIDFIIDKTDQAGVLVQNIRTNATVKMPFKDSKQLGTSYNNLADSVWQQANYTTGTLPSITVNPGERLNFTMVYKSGLDMILRHDDQTMVTTQKSSYLQMPPPDNPFPAYFVYDKSNPLTVYALNEGPYGSWLVYQGTRAVFDNPSGATSYAALICSVNSTYTSLCSTDSPNSAWRVTEDRDSIFIPVNNTAKLAFWDVQDRPDRNLSGGNVIPAGDYDLYVFIDGYDERGQKFLRNMFLGRVKVVN